MMKKVYRFIRFNRQKILFLKCFLYNVYYKLEIELKSMRELEYKLEVKAEEALYHVSTQNISRARMDSQHFFRQLF